jgi:hypothetical protein
MGFAFGSTHPTFWLGLLVGLGIAVLGAVGAVLDCLVA